MQGFAQVTAVAALLAVSAAQSSTQLPPIQVTATRDAEAVDRIPASVTVISGDDLRARGANDLRTALQRVAGVEGTPGGDGGPAGSVPALWGLREVDAFLLVMDGVPVGGAFNPLTVTVDLTGVERIEILRGAAPVMYGATSFVGVIHIIHYAAGTAPNVIGATVGTEGSYGISTYGTLSAEGWKQSVTANLEKRGYSSDRTESERAHVLYRAAKDGFHVDLELGSTPQKPGSVVWRNGANLRTDLVPADANHNPSDAKIDQQHYALTGGYDAATSLGNWGSTLSIAHTKDEIIRGFHEANATNVARGYEQEREILDVYFDTHVVQPLTAAVKLTYGLDVLFGRGETDFFRFPYQAAPDGSFAWSSADARANCAAGAPNPAPNTEECKDEEAEVERNFAGIYVQTEWQATEAVNVMVGLRLNRTEEEQEGEDENNPGTEAKFKSEKTRPSGVIGATWDLLRSGNDSFAVYADYRNSYKPVAAELAPTGVLKLDPETANSYEFGFRGAMLDGRLQYDASAFRMDFKNLRVLGTPTQFVNGGKTRFTGGEVETRYALMEAVQLLANYSYHDSRFIDFNRDGTPAGVVNGNRFELAPYHLAALGAMLSPARGLSASAIANHTGSRKLNKGNTLQQGSFTTIDASLGWNFEKFKLQVAGQNLTDRRDVIAESELSGEIAGASSYYRLPGRSVFLNFTMPL